MAKRELSNTLKNLKFMQRATQKEEKPKEEEEIKANGGFVFPGALVKKCVVIMEGDPHPGAVKGRMSFQNFNPSIDKLKEEAANGHQEGASTSSGDQSGGNFESGNGRSDDVEGGTNGNAVEGEVKRKHPEEFSEEKQPKKVQKNKQSSPNEGRSSQKQPKREKLDWSVLRPPKSHKKRSSP